MNQATTVNPLVRSRAIHRPSQRAINCATTNLSPITAGLLMLHPTIQQITTQLATSYGDNYNKSAGL